MFSSLRRRQAVACVNDRSTRLPYIKHDCMPHRVCRSLKYRPTDVRVVVPDMENGRAETGNRSRWLGIYLKSCSVPLYAGYVATTNDFTWPIAACSEGLQSTLDRVDQARAWKLQSSAWTTRQNGPANVALWWAMMAFASSEGVSEQVCPSAISTASNPQSRAARQVLSTQY